MFSFFEWIEIAHLEATATNFDLRRYTNVEVSFLSILFLEIVSGRVRKSKLKELSGYFYKNCSIVC